MCRLDSRERVSPEVELKFAGPLIRDTFSPVRRFPIVSEKIGLTLKFAAGDKDDKVCVWDLNPKAGNADLVPPVQPLPYEPGPRRPATTLPTLNVMNEKKEAGESSRVVKFNPRYAMFASAGVDAVSLNPCSQALDLTGPRFLRRYGFREKTRRQRRMIQMQAEPLAHV